MDVTVETPGGLIRQMRVRLPADRLSIALGTRLKQIAGRARIAGFRPGKAPLKIVEQQFGESARLEVIQDLVRGSYPEAVDKAGVRPASAPQFEVVTEQPGQPLEYVARFEVYPDIKLKSLDGLTVDKPVAEVTGPDIDKVVESLRRARRTMAAVTRPAQKGDVCKIDFEGFVDGTAFAGGKGDDVEFEIGQGRFLPDLENGIVGHAAGEAFEVDVQFPPDYRNEQLKGKKALFQVSLKVVQEPTLPAIDEAFLKAHNVEEGKGEAGLRDKIKASLEGERDKSVKNRLKVQVLEQLLTANPIEVPSAMVAQELGRLRDETAARFNAAQLKPEQKLQMFPDEVLEPGARRRVSLGLLIGEVLRERKIVIEAARIERLLDEMAADYEQAEQVKAYYRQRPELMQGLRAMVLEEQVVESLLGGATQKDVQMPLDELLKPAGQAQ
ncbi:MAG TPA: trigger factor [Verrucomicrobiae bacterium]|nr:trigger factor [Verrucomicrobiae bacterium]